MSTHLKANRAFRGMVFMIHLRICENFTEFSKFLKICNLIDYSLMTIKMIWITDLIRWNWSWGHVELTWKEMVVSAHANLERSKFLSLRFSLFRVSFCKKNRCFFDFIEFSSKYGYPDGSETLIFWNYIQFAIEWYIICLCY